MGRWHKVSIFWAILLGLCTFWSLSPCEAMVIKFAQTGNMDEIGTIAAAKMAKNIEEWSGGNITVNLFPGGQLGAMREHYEACQMGAIEMIYVAASAAAKFVPEVGILDLPFLFPTKYDDAWTVIDGNLTAILSEKLEEKGFKMLALAPYGYKVITTSGRQIKGLDDLKGIKIRIMPSKTLELTYQAWGAMPTPVEYSELYVALQQRIVDGQENGLTVVQSQRFHEVQDYLTVTKHALFQGLLVCNKKWFDGLSTENQDIVLKASKENLQFQRESVPVLDMEILKEMEEKGMEIFVLPEEEVEKFRKASKVVHDGFANLGEKESTILKAVYEDIEKLPE